MEIKTCKPVNSFPQKKIALLGLKISIYVP